MNNRILLTGLAAIVSGAFLFGCGDDAPADSMEQTTERSQMPSLEPTPEPASTNTIVDVAIANGSFTTLVDLVAKAGLVDTLKGGEFTVFAPTDEAFSKVDRATLDKLGSDPDLLRRVLTYHVVGGKVMSADVKPGKVKSVEGNEITITVRDGKVMVDGATVVAVDVPASNGVIHVIDRVILPPM